VEMFSGQSGELQSSVQYSRRENVYKEFTDSSRLLSSLLLLWIGK